MPIACALALVACQRGTEEKAPGPGQRRQPAVPPPTAGPAALRQALGIPADARYETPPEKSTAPASTRKLKTEGPVGDWLEGDVFWFRAASVRACGDVSPGGAKVIGAEVEIRAKAKLTFSPRELRLGSGGVVFQGSLDLDRQIRGCLPLLGVAWLKKDEVMRGFVLFDVPEPLPKALELHYQPTRWGGAGQVRVLVSALAAR